MPELSGEESRGGQEQDDLSVVVHCSCGHRNVISDLQRGLEAECENCGRIFMVPLMDNVLHLRTSSVRTIPVKDVEEAQSLLEITPNVKTGQLGMLARQRKARKARRIWFLLIGIGIGVLLGLLYFADAF